MCSWSVVSHRVKQPVTHTPASSSRAPIAHGQSPLPMIAAWQEAPTNNSVATRKANRGRQLRNTMSPSTQPAPKPADTIAHERAPFISVSAITGLTTNKGGSTMAWDTVIPQRKASTQDRRRASDHPSTRLDQKCSVVARGSSSEMTSCTIRGRSGARRATETTNVAASKSIATPGPPAKPTSNPASNGPEMAATEKLSPLKAFAGCRFSGLTVEGSSPVNAGAKNASAAPYTAARSARCGTSARPLTSSRPAVSWVASRTRSEEIRMRFRSSLSAQTPAGNASSANGANCAADTSATCATPPPTDNTAKGRTTLVTRSPRIERIWLPNSRRYCGSSRSTAGTRSLPRKPLIVRAPQRRLPQRPGWQDGDPGVLQEAYRFRTCGSTPRAAE